MACCICNLAGHDEELHGELGEELLALRMVVASAQRAVDASHNTRVAPKLWRALEDLEETLIEAGLRERVNRTGERTT